MIERVAKILAERNKSACNPDWTAWVDDARAIIVAMREPTEAMVEAGELTLTEPIDAQGLPIECDEAAIWKAMIDAAGKQDGAATD
jgi:hypothetical protein